MCQVSQPAWGAWTAGASGVGVCLWWAVASVVVHLGEGNVSEPVRHRDELPSDASGTDSYVGVALLLRNVWVWLHWQVLACRQRGGRRIDLGPLSFRKMLVWLQHGAE